MRTKRARAFSPTSASGCFRYPPLAAEELRRAVSSASRVLNMYENYPFWATFFKALGFRVILSPLSDRRLYERGMESIPSESGAYPAKLAHGHVQWLIDEGVHTIFHPCVFFEHQETPDAQNHFNCPIVVSYPENLKNNVEAAADGGWGISSPSLPSRARRRSPTAWRASAASSGEYRRRKRGRRFPLPGPSSKGPRRIFAPRARGTQNAAGGTLRRRSRGAALPS